MFSIIPQWGHCAVLAGEYIEESNLPVAFHCPVDSSMSHIVFCLFDYQMWVCKSKLKRGIPTQETKINMQPPLLLNLTLPVCLLQCQLNDLPIDSSISVSQKPCLYLIWSLMETWDSWGEKGSTNLVVSPRATEALKTGNFFKDAEVYCCTDSRRHKLEQD